MARIRRSLVKITVKAFTVLQIYRDIWGILTQSERRQFLLLLGMTLCMALFEVAGVTLIMPLRKRQNAKPFKKEIIILRVSASLRTCNS